MIHSSWTGLWAFRLLPQPYSVFLVGLMVLQISVASTADAQGFTQVIAHTGDPVPGGNGTFREFRHPVLSDAGQAVFPAILEGTSGGQTDDYGLFRGMVGGVTRLARTRAAGFATSGITWLGWPAVNDSGQAAFNATIQRALFMGGAEVSSVVRGSGGALTTIAQEGHPAPDGNGAFGDFAFTDVAINDAGQAAFRGFLSGTAGGMSDDAGIFVGSGGPLTQVAREGQTVPDGNGTFSVFWDPVLNDAGQTAFHADLTGTTRGTGDDEGIYRNSGATLTQIARERPAGVFISGLTDLSSPSINESGAVTYTATFLESLALGGASRQGVFRSSGGPTTTIALEGGAAPDGNGTFSRFLFSPALNDSGQTAFLAWLDGTSGGIDDDEGIYLGAGGPLTQIAREGQTTPDGTLTLTNLSSVVLNNAGQVAFQANAIRTLPDGSVESSSGIYMFNGFEVLEVARSGQSLGNGTIRTLAGITDYSGERDGFNELGQIAYRAKLTSDEEVIAIWTPPALLGDYNNDGIVDAADYVVWRKTDGQTGINLAADGNGNQQVDLADYNVWSSHFGQTAGPGAASGAFDGGVPEPASCLSLLLGFITLFAVGRCR